MWYLLLPIELIRHQTTTAKMVMDTGPSPPHTDREW